MQCNKWKQLLPRRVFTHNAAEPVLCGTVQTMENFSFFMLCCTATRCVDEWLFFVVNLSGLLIGLEGLLELWPPTVLHHEIMHRVTGHTTASSYNGPDSLLGATWAQNPTNFMFFFFFFLGWEYWEAISPKEVIWSTAQYKGRSVFFSGHRFGLFLKEVKPTGPVLGWCALLLNRCNELVQKQELIVFQRMLAFTGIGPHWHWSQGFSAQKERTPDICRPKNWWQPVLLEPKKLKSMLLKPMVHSSFFVLALSHVFAWSVSVGNLSCIYAGPAFVMLSWMPSSPNKMTVYTIASLFASISQLKAWQHFHNCKANAKIEQTVRNRPRLLSSGYCCS